MLLFLFLAFVFFLVHNLGVDLIPPYVSVRLDFEEEVQPYRDVQQYRQFQEEVAKLEKDVLQRQVNPVARGG